MIRIASANTGSNFLFLQEQPTIHLSVSDYAISDLGSGFLEILGSRPFITSIEVKRVVATVRSSVLSSTTNLTKVIKVLLTRESKSQLYEPLPAPETACMLRRLSAALLWVKMMGAFFFLAIYLVTQIAFLATSSAASAAGKSSSQVGIMTGLVVGLGLGFGLILVAFFFIIWSRKHRDQKDSEECSPPWEAKELPSPTPMIHMPGKTLSELPDGQDPLQHELPHHSESPSELDNGISSECRLDISVSSPQKKRKKIPLLVRFSLQALGST